MISRNRAKVSPLVLCLGALVLVVILTIGAVVYIRGSANRVNGDELPPIALQQLSTYDGKDGNPSYFAYEGKIYDVSNSPLFKNGKHYSHYAGTDLTGKLQGAPHGVEVFVPFKIVARLVP